MLADGDGVVASRAPRILFIGSPRWRKTWLPLRAVGATGLALPIDGWRSYPGMFRKALAWGLAERPDVVLTDATPPAALLAALLARQLGVPSVYRIRGIGDAETIQLVHDAAELRRWDTAAKFAFVHPMYGLALRLMTRWVADCRTTAEGLRRRFPALADRIGWAHTPCEPNGPRTATEPLLLSATNLHAPRKYGGLLRHWEALLDGLHGCPEARLRICGDGLFRRAFTRELARRRVSRRIAWVGHSPTFREDLARAACLLHLSDQDSYPSVVLEARAAGCPVIANDVGGVREMIDDGVDGFILRDPRDLPDRMRRILGDTALRSRMAEAGRARVLRENSMERIGREFLAEIGAALQGRSNRGRGTWAAG